MSMTMIPGIFMSSRRKLLALLLLPASLALTACDPFGTEEQAKAAAAKEAEGRAIGSGCRHTGRSLEDCYMLNPKALKAAVFNGWRDMDAYMRENKIENMPPPDYRAKPEEKPGEAKGAEAKPAEAEKGMPPAKAAKH